MAYEIVNINNVIHTALYIEYYRVLYTCNKIIKFYFHTEDFFKATSYCYYYFIEKESQVRPVAVLGAF